MKLKLLFVFFSISLIFQINASAGGFFGLPKPTDTNLVSSTKQDVSGAQFMLHEYRSKLTESQILDFYETKLKNKGWSRLQVSSFGPAQQAGFKAHTYVKDDKMLVLNFSPFKTESLTIYTISEGTFPALAGSGEQPLDMFKEPKKVSFMPIYPGARQVDFNQTPSGIRVGYIATGGTEAVKGFYLQNLPKYGWSNVDEKQTDKKEYDLSKIGEDCPTCAPLSEEATSIASQLDMSGVTLKFKQGKKTLMMNIFSMGQMPSFGGPSSGSGGLGDTMITVLYDEK